ncbi:MAG: cobyrinate a,c-diamide synthase [Alphaproteobacteria bacterium]
MKPEQSRGRASSARGLIIAAPASGCGKTVLTLGLLRHLKRQKVATASFKVGPDYIDPAFHAAASGRECVNLDSWAMRRETLTRLAASLAQESEVIIGEGVMGLFDGASTVAKHEGGRGVADGLAANDGSTADLAAKTGWPVVLVIDAKGQGASAAAVVQGFARFRADIAIAGVVFNRVASEAHARVLYEASARAVPEIAVLGSLPNDPAFALPARHLGLVQARENPDLEAFLDRAAEIVGARIDRERMIGLARPVSIAPAHEGPPAPLLPPLGQRMAVAVDDAFAFTYYAVLEGWRAGGVELSLFSPLADEGPDGNADAVYLPGGYPELHAGKLAANGRFMTGLRAAARRGAVIYGECGGYMVLGRALTDGEGRTHEMAGLLPLETSFAERKLHLGYRKVTLVGDAGPLGGRDARFRGHEFHYATVLGEGPGEPLFSASDAQDGPLGPAGLRERHIMGSFIHLIDGAEAR